MCPRFYKNLQVCWERYKARTYSFNSMRRYTTSFRRVSRPSNCRCWKYTESLWTWTKETPQKGREQEFLSTNNLYLSRRWERTYFCRWSSRKCSCSEVQARRDTTLHFRWRCIEQVVNELYSFGLRYCWWCRQIWKFLCSQTSNRLRGWRRRRPNCNKVQVGERLP